MICVHPLMGSTLKEILPLFDSLSGEFPSILNPITGWHLGQFIDTLDYVRMLEKEKKIGKRHKRMRTE